MTTYSDYQQRLLDQHSGADMDRRAEARKRLKEPRTLLCGCVSDGSYICDEHRKMAQ
jgi:hypothetical protein